MNHASPALCFALATAVPVAGQGDSTIVVHLELESGSIGSGAPRHLTLSKQPPIGPKLPAGMGTPYFGTVAMADGQLAFALDANIGNPRLWVDRDFDGDLAEEKTTRLTKQASNHTRSQVVLVPYDGETDAVPIEMVFRCSVAASKPTLSIQMGVHRRGTVVLGGRLRFVAVVDGNGDARFDDAERDRLYIDLDGDGKLQSFGQKAAELIHAGEPFRIGDEGWTARVATASGRVIEFTRSKTIPPARLRRWPDSTAPEAGRKRQPPQESLKTLLQRYEDELQRPYAERNRTISLLGAVGTKAAFEALVKIADDDDESFIQNAALSALGNPAFLESCGDRLAAMARKADTRTGYALAGALYDAGHPDRDAIYLEMMKSSVSRVVMGAARYLAYSGTEAAKAAIVAVTREHSDSFTRYSAYTQGARNLPGGPPIEAVLRAASDDYGMLRTEAIKDLGVLGHPDAVKHALQASRERPMDTRLGEALCEVLGAAGNPAAVAAILGLLEDDGLDARVRKKVVEQLRLIRAPKSVDVVVKALNSRAAPVRAVAAEILAALPERRVTDALLKRAKKEKDTQVLPLLLEALGDHGDPIALALLVQRTRGRKQDEVRTAAVRGLARLGFHHDKVRAFFLTMLESRDWVDRVLALDAAKAARDGSLVAKVLKSVDHAQWQVRLATVEVLAAMRSRDAVLPLIERLDLETERRIRDAIAGALFNLTGQNLYDNSVTWRLWWRENGSTFAVPDEIPVMPERSAGGTGAGFYGIPVATERVVFVIDQSGSMSAMAQATETYKEKELNRLDVAIRETLGALAKLDKRAMVNFIMFHSTIHPWKDQLQRLGPNRKELTSRLESQQPTGGTNIYDALEIALRMRDVDTIFLLSDGSPGSGKFVATDDILRAIRRENQTRRIAIHCVSIGMESRLLRQLAEQNGGLYVSR